ncbi:MAG: YbaN family protein [Treponemataceae bacterium]|nr:YbaN family protein [Treponemataceae bacterium]
MKLLKPLWIAFGFVCVALGAAGIPLPVLPTTPFLLLAAFCFARDSERVDRWFRGTRLYKEHLESFVQDKSMTLKTKLCILLPVSALLAAAFCMMSRRNTPGTIAGRIVLVLAAAAKYVYFFACIKTVRPVREESGSGGGC